MASEVSARFSLFTPPIWGRSFDASDFCHVFFVQLQLFGESTPRSSRRFDGSNIEILGERGTFSPWRFALLRLALLALSMPVFRWRFAPVAKRRFAGSTFENYGMSPKRNPNPLDMITLGLSKSFGFSPPTEIAFDNASYRWDINISSADLKTQPKDVTFQAFPKWISSG